MALENHIEAAQGYLELGMPMDAWNELEEIEAKDRGKIEVLKVRVDVCRALEQWELMAEIARHLHMAEPEEFKHVDDMACALRRFQGLDAADKMLSQLLLTDPDNANVIYKLGCFEFLRAGMDVAKPTLQRAFTLDANLKGVAMDDPDLRGFWEGLSNNASD